MKAMSVALLCLTVALGCSSDGGSGKDGQAARDRAPGGDGAPPRDRGVAVGDQGGSAGVQGSCKVDLGGKQTCAEYVGSGFAPAPALDVAKNACTQASGTWAAAPCARDGMQGYCDWFEGQPTEERHYYYNYATEDLNKEKAACESVDGHRWHRT